MRQADIWEGRYARAAGDAPRADTWIAAYAARFEEKRGGLFVDLGCGAGGNARWLHDNGYQVAACDFSGAALDLLRRQCPAVKTYNADMLDGLPFTPSSAGVVLASLSLHYFPLEDTERVVKNIYDVLEDDGLLLVRVNSVQEYATEDSADAAETLETDYYRMKDGTTKRYFTEQSLSSLLSGFETLSINSGVFMYHGHIKHYVDGLARKAARCV